MSKSILITGSTDGIGKLAAEKLAKEGHAIYLHGRNPQKLEKLVSAIKQESGNEQIKGFVADFSDLDAVKSMADNVLTEISTLDVLINNAGVFKSPTDQTKEGLDIRFVVNYLAPYMLTQALLPVLEKASAPRIINLSSAAQAPVSLEALAGKKRLSFRESYAQSKLALTMWSFHLAKAHPHMTVIPVNPGSLLNTNMVREGFGTFWSSADKGGKILYDLAVSAEYEGQSGKYFDNDKGQEKGAFGEAHADAYNASFIEKLMEATQAILSS